MMVFLIFWFFDSAVMNMTWKRWSRWYQDWVSSSCWPMRSHQHLNSSQIVLKSKGSNIPTCVVSLFFTFSKTLPSNLPKADYSMFNLSVGWSVGRQVSSPLILPSMQWRWETKPIIYVGKVNDVDSPWHMLTIILYFIVQRHTQRQIQKQRQRRNKTSKKKVRLYIDITLCCDKST